MSTTIQELELKVESNASTATKPIGALASALKDLKTATKGGFGAVDKLASQLSALSEATNNMDDESANKLFRLSWALEKLSGKVISASIATQINKVNAAINNIDPQRVAVLGELATQVEKMAKYSGYKIPLVGVSNPRSGTPRKAKGETAGAKDSASEEAKAAENVAQAESKMAIFLGTLRSVRSEIYEITHAFKFFKEDFAQMNGVGKFINGLNFKSVAKGVSAAIGGITKFSDVVKGKFTLGLISGTGGLTNLLGAFKRIALYRGIRFVFSQLANAMKEGINNLYQYSLLMGTEFAGSMDRLATSALYLKNSMGAMASPIINALAPAIDYAVDKIVELLNWINQLVSRLRGASSWTKAVKYAKSYAEAADGAAGSTRKAAKALKDYTIGIDELNVIRPDDDTGSGGGGGGGTPGMDYSKMFEEVPIDSAVGDFADRLKEAFNKSDWKGLGTLIGNKFNGIINSIKWGKIGKKLGKAFNGAVQTIYYTLDTISWTNIGDKVATLLNNALSEIDFGFVGRILVKGVTIGLDLFIGFITKLDFGRVANAVSQFLIGAMDEAAKWIQGVDWAKLGNDLFAKLIDFVSNIDWAGVVGTAFELVGSIIGGGAALLGGFFGDAWEKLKSYFTDNGEFTWEGFLDGIVNGLKSIGTWIVDNIFTPFLDGFKNAFGIASPSKEMMTMGDYVIEGLLKGITDALSNIGTWVKDNIFSPIWNSVLKAFGISSGESGQTKKQGQAIPKGLYAGTRAAIPGGQSTMTGWAGKVLNWFGGTGTNSTVSKFGKIGTDVGLSFKEKVGIAGAKNESTLTKWGKDVKSWFSAEASESAFYGFASNVVAGFVNGISSLAYKAVNVMKSLAGDIKKAFTKEMDENSPSKVFYGYGKFVVLGFDNAITDMGSESVRKVSKWATSLQGAFSPVMSVDTSRVAGMDDYVGMMTAAASYNASVNAEASFTDETVMPLLRTIADATTRQANKSEQTVVRVNGRDLVSAIDAQRKANGYKVAY